MSMIDMKNLSPENVANLSREKYIKRLGWASKLHFALMILSLVGGTINNIALWYIFHNVNWIAALALFIIVNYAYIYLIYKSYNDYKFCKNEKRLYLKNPNRPLYINS